MWSSSILDCEDSALCLLGSWDFTIQLYIVLAFSSDALFGFATTFVMLFLSFARHGWSHRSFQFSPRILENFWILFVIWIDKTNTPSFFEHCRALVFLLPIPVFLDSERLYQFSSKLLAIHNLVWWSFESLSISPRTTCILLPRCDLHDLLVE